MNSSPALLIARLAELGARVTAAGDRLRIAAPRALPSDLLAGVRERKGDLLLLLATPMIALRAAYRCWFELVVVEADGQPVDPAESTALHQHIVKLTDDAGPAWADALYADELRRFRCDTGRCGLCGGDLGTMTRALGANGEA